MQQHRYSNSMDKGKSMEAGNRRANNRRTTCNSMGASNIREKGKTMGASNM
jgi:hypothetical protein